MRVPPHVFRESAARCSPADQKAREIWVRDWPQPMFPPKGAGHQILVHSMRVAIFNTSFDVLVVEGSTVKDQLN